MPSLTTRLSKTHSPPNTQKQLPLSYNPDLWCLWLITVRGETEICVENVNRPLKVTFLRNLPHQVILGENMLRQGQGVIDLHVGQLKWHGHTWRLNYDNKKKCFSIGTLLPNTKSEIINLVVRDNADVFSAKNESNGFCSLPPMTINVEGNPISQQAYRTTLSKRQMVDKAIDEMLQDEIIRLSSSPWARPITLVPKKDGSTRFCVDYRRLNEITIKDKYPLPLIQDIYDQVGGNSIYSALDLKAGYWRIAMAEPDIPKRSFRCHRGHYEFCRMPFGLVNAPALFQRTMDKVLSDLFGVCAMVFLDDIAVYSINVEEHAKHLQLVFVR